MKEDFKVAFSDAVYNVLGRPSGIHIKHMVGAKGEHIVTDTLKPVSGEGFRQLNFPDGTMVQEMVSNGAYTIRRTTP